ncbi:MAG TPA: DUF2975 domain-containing protein [Fastidiosipila sp.]|nr:DUF2975 domain-containing protein [Fastidiosipila sp.]
MQRVKPILLSGLLFLAIAFFVGMFPFLIHMSAQYVNWNPELSHLRIPFLVLIFLVLLVSIVALVLALFLVLRSTRKNIFESLTVRMLNLIGHSFLAGALFFGVMYIYGYAQLGKEIGLVGGYLVLALAGYFLAAILVYFITDLFRKAVEYKEENELTV